MRGGVIDHLSELGFSGGAAALRRKAGQGKPKQKEMEYL